MARVDRSNYFVSSGHSFLCGIGNQKDQVSIYTGERDHSKKEKKDESNSTGILWQW